MAKTNTPPTPIPVYHYDPDTLEYVGEGVSDICQIEGTHLLPGYSTPVKPPAAVAGKVPVFDPAADTWSQVEDHRGAMVYDTATGDSSVIDLLGPIPTGKTTTAPLSFQTWDSNAGAWVDDLPALKKALCAEVEGEAEAARLRYITGGAGQAAVYMTKADQADAYKAAGYPADTTAYPMIAAEVGISGATAQEVADLIIATRDGWLTIASQIEAARLGATGSTGTINVAADRTAAEAAKDTAIAALQAI